MEADVNAPTQSRPAFVYGLQAASWVSGEIIEPGMTKIGFTARPVAQRVAEMQRQLGAGGVHKLVIAFEAPVKDQRVERAVHRHLRLEGRHLAAGSAVEWFAISPQEAREIVLAYAEGRLDVDLTLAKTAAETPSTASASPNRTSIRGRKEIKMTPARAAALAEVRALAARGGPATEISGGRWGAAATALAVEQGISKDGALILMREWSASAEQTEAP